MIFNSLNLNENATLNTKPDNEKPALSLMSEEYKVDSDLEFEHLLTEVKDENGLELSFVDHLQKLTETNKLALEENIPIKNIEIGNKLPLLGKSPQDFDNSLIASTDIIEGKGVNKKGESKDDALILNANRGNVIRNTLNAISIDTHPNLFEDKLVVDQTIANVRQINIHSSSIEKISKIEAQIFETTPNIAKNRTDQFETANKLATDDKLPIGLISVLNEKKMTNEGVPVSNQPFDTFSVEKSKNSILNTDYRNLLARNKTLTEAISSQTTQITEFQGINNNENNTIPIIPILSTSIKQVIEQGIQLEQMTFKQPINANGQFANGLSIRIQWMLQQALSSAQIMLDPPELGPMNVKIVQAGSEMNIVFQVQTAQGKDAIEDNLAKLKEMLLAQGINLGETEIQHKQNGQDEDKQQSLANKEKDSELQDSSDLSTSKNTESSVALLDTYF